MGWLGVPDIPFNILASLLYRATRHFIPGGTNMLPRAPRVRQGPETHGTTTRHAASSTGFNAPMAGRPSPYGKATGPGAAAATLGSSNSTAPELLGHAMQGRSEEGCWLTM